MKDFYITHHNGSTPFRVEYDRKYLYAFKERPFEDDEDPEDDDFDFSELYSNTPCVVVPYKQVFTGEDDEEMAAEDFEEGNTVLAVANNGTGIYIGNDIYIFKPKDKILRYYSPIGPNDVPYPYAVGEKYTYLMIENRYVANNVLVDNPYMQLYDHQGKYKHTKKHFKKLKTKIIQSDD